MYKHNYDFTSFNYADEKFSGFNEILYLVTKRCFDTILSFLMIVALFVLLLVIFVAVYVCTRSYPIYIDKRVGYHGKTIKVYKFKSMVDDAESNISSYLTDDQLTQWELERKIENDPRTTKIGLFLRRTSLDELPQLFNVLIGNMSFVGPRPIKDYELLNNFTEEEAKVVLSAKPGVTGNWQVYGRCTDSWKNGKRKELVLDYIKSRSVLEDLKIFILTIPSCVGFAFHKRK